MAPAVAEAEVVATATAASLRPRNDDHLIMDLLLATGPEAGVVVEAGVLADAMATGKLPNPF